MTGRLSVVVALSLLVGCGFPTQDSSQQIGRDDQSEPVTSGTNGDLPAVESITVWFIRDDVLVPVTRRVPPPSDAAAALAAVGAGVTPAEG